jgi:hypothetical protein
MAGGRRVPQKTGSIFIIRTFSGTDHRQEKENSGI